MSETLTAARPVANKKFKVTSGHKTNADRVLIYGEGGIGKSTLAAACDGVVFADLEGSTNKISTSRVEGIATWADLRSWLQTGDFTDVKSIAIDTMTAAEDLCIKHVIENVPAGKNKTVTSIKDYGWGDGYTYVYEEWKRLLSDLDTHQRQGRSVILIAHARTGKVPNPAGEDYLRYEPRLMVNNQVSLMAATVEWCDHVLFIGYDLLVNKEGVAEGKGTRTLYTIASATHVAKNREMGDAPIVLGRGNGKVVWEQMQAAKKNPPPDLD